MCRGCRSSSRFEASTTTGMLAAIFANMEDALDLLAESERLRAEARAIREEMHRAKWQAKLQNFERFRRLQAIKAEQAANRASPDHPGDAESTRGGRGPP